ncbi:restriction endonuclease subunit S [Chromobacterium subtsugae]|uniref:restriction endonuclease subunit S n=1 Tax=Chromobacterium subtsugae TaxID=251747 RepID=UPI0009BBBBAA|nr:restriction endonuclease subunit S [Chromobacterium subtsugae]
MVPKGWERLPIKEVCASIIDCVNKTAPVVDSPTPYKMIRTTNVRNGRVNTEDVRFVSEQTYIEWTRRGKPEKGDLIFTREAPVGEVGVLEEDQGIFLGQRTMMYRVAPERANNYFVFYSLQTTFCQKQIEDFSNGGTVAHMRVPDCGEILLNVPPLLEQKKIAQILSTWDQAIATTERLLDHARQQKKALMQQLLTGKKRFPGFDREWVLYRLKDICELGSGYSAPQDPKYFTETGYDFLRVSDIGSSNVRNAPISRDKINDIAINDFRMRQVKAGSTIFTKSGASLLLNQRAQLMADTFIVSHLGFATPRDIVDKNYLYYLFCVIDFSTLASGTSLPALQLSVLNNVIVRIPDIKEQEKIAATLSSADVTIENLQSQLDGLKQEKKALMQQLLTGKRRVQCARDEAEA